MVDYEVYSLSEKEIDRQIQELKDGYDDIHSIIDPSNIEAPNTIRIISASQSHIAININLTAKDILRHDIEDIMLLMKYTYLVVRQLYNAGEVSGFEIYYDDNALIRIPNLHINDTSMARSIMKTVGKSFDETPSMYPVYDDLYPRLNSTTRNMPAHFAIELPVTVKTSTAQETIFEFNTRFRRVTMSSDSEVQKKTTGYTSKYYPSGHTTKYYPSRNVTNSTNVSVLGVIYDILFLGIHVPPKDILYKQISDIM